MAGAVYTAGAIAVTESEIIDFARRYDPQPMHTDPDAAARGRFGGLIASGWHTGAMMMRLFADNFLSPASSLASPGLDELRWHLPVRPGDLLSLRVTILEARPLAQEPGAGRPAQPCRGAEPDRRGRDEPEADQPRAPPAGSRRIARRTTGATPDVAAGFSGGRKCSAATTAS